MVTDPGDLVLDPTCGSGTTAYVSEQWGRRWITIDTSRVSLALARARLMGARYPYYLLADSEDGRLKEAELTGRPPSDATVQGNIRQGFVYERAQHITLKSIANNAEIDVIWEAYQDKLEPLRERLNVTLSARIGKNGKSRARPMRTGRAPPERRMRNGGIFALPDKRKSISPSRRRRISNSSTTVHMKTPQKSALADHSPSKACRPTGWCPPTRSS